MKKFLFISAVLLVVVFAIYSCGDKKSDNSSNGENNEENIVKNEGNDLNFASKKKSVYEEFTKLVISDDEREKLNTFFSNFSEQYMEPFDKETLSDSKMIDFAVSHNYKNNYKRFESSGENTVKIKKEFIEESAEKYFGRKITSHQSTEESPYKNGYYYISEADGEATRISEIEELFDAGDNYYFAIVAVYHLTDTGSEDDGPEFDEKMTAYITKKDNRYIINEYRDFIDYQTY